MMKFYLPCYCRASTIWLLPALQPFWKVWSARASSHREALKCQTLPEVYLRSPALLKFLQASKTVILKTDKLDDFSLLQLALDLNTQMLDINRLQSLSLILKHAFIPKNCDVRDPHQGSTLRKYLISPAGLVTETFTSPEIFLLALILMTTLFK